MTVIRIFWLMTDLGLSNSVKASNPPADAPIPTIGNKIFSRFFTSSILGSIGIDNSHHSEIEYLILAMVEWNFEQEFEFVKSEIIIIMTNYAGVKRWVICTIQ